MHINTLVTVLNRLWKESGCNFDEFILLLDFVDPDLADAFEHGALHTNVFIDLHLGNMHTALRKVL